MLAATEKQRMSWTRQVFCFIVQFKTIAAAAAEEEFLLLKVGRPAHGAVSIYVKDMLEQKRTDLQNVEVMIMQQPSHLE